MATASENIQTAIDSIAAAIAANPTAINYSIDGQSVTHGDLVAKLKSLQEALGVLQGPVEVESYGVI